MWNIVIAAELTGFEIIPKCCQQNGRENQASDLTAIEKLIGELLCRAFVTMNMHYCTRYIFHGIVQWNPRLARP